MNRQQVTAGLGLVIILAFVGSTALAANGLKTESKTVTITADETGAITARCEKGTKAVSGGFRADFQSEGPNPIPAIRVMESTRSGARGWNSSGFNSGEVAGDLTSFGYCRDEKLRRASATVQLSQGEGATTTAHCPRGTKALSGGFEVVADSGTRSIKSSKKAGKRGWSVASPRTGFGPSGELTGHVICRDGKALKTKSVSRTLESGEAAELEVKCKRAQRVLSGGFDAFEDESLGFASPQIAASRKRGRRTWIVDVVAANEATATAYAYCEQANR